MYICEARYKYTRMDKNKIHSISDWFSVYRDDIKKKKKKIRAVYHSSVYKDEKRKKMKKEWKKNWNNCTKSALTMIVICWNVSNRSRVGRKRRKMKYTSFLSRIIPIKKKQTKWNCVYFLLSFFNIWNKGLEMVCTPNFLAYSSDPGSNLFQSIKQ